MLRMGTLRVAERTGFVRTLSFGRAEVLRRSRDFWVSSLRKLGALGRRGGGGLRNPIEEGGGEGV